MTIHLNTNNDHKDSPSTRLVSLMYSFFKNQSNLLLIKKKKKHNDHTDSAKPSTFMTYKELYLK